MMAILKENGMGIRTLVMNNISIHKTEKVNNIVAKQGFEILCLPSYSPFLNPTEEFWSKLKAGVKRNLLTSDDNLLPRIVNSAHHVSADDCKGCIRHSLMFAPRWIEGDKMLRPVFFLYLYIFP